MKTTAPHIGKSGNKRCPIEVRFRQNGKTVRKRFLCELSAIQYYNELKKELALPSFVSFSDAERVELSRIRDFCKMRGITLSNVVDMLMSGKSANIASLTSFDDALSAFLGDCATRGLRDDSVQFYARFISSWRKLANIKTLSDATDATVERFFSFVASPDHYKRALRAFYNFCMSKKWISANPFINAKTPRKIRERELPTVLSPEAVECILRSVSPEWTPVFALLAFCGVRPNEIVAPEKCGLKISAVDFTSKRIVIPADVAKTRVARIFEPPPNVWAWLTPLLHRKKTEYIAPSTYAVFRKQKSKTGITIPHDSLRHSFASYGFHFLGAERTVEILGHVGGFAVFAKHDKGLATPDAAKRYFEIVPTI